MVASARRSTDSTKTHHHYITSFTLILTSSRTPHIPPTVTLSLIYKNRIAHGPDNRGLLPQNTAVQCTGCTCHLQTKSSAENRSSPFLIDPSVIPSCDRKEPSNPQTLLAEKNCHNFHTFIYEISFSTPTIEFRGKLRSPD